jgi:hypothetical protein
LSDPLVLKRVHADQVFEAGTPFLPRLLSAWRLQVAHARTEQVPQRYVFVAAASVRLAARVGRVSLRRITVQR